MLGEHQLALEYVQKVLTIYQTIFGDNDHYVIPIKNLIQSILNK